MNEDSVDVDWTKNVVTKGSTEFPVDPWEYWIIAPTRTTWRKREGFIGPLEFGFMLHNAKIGRGVLPPLATLSSHFSPRSLKKGDSLVAEKLIEERRVANHPEKPSRLNSYFLNTHRDVAERRADNWGWTHRTLVRCHVLTTTGHIHYAIISNFEELARDPTLSHLADQYWEQSPSLVNEKTKYEVEVLADCGLYFPDWSDFTVLDRDSMVAAHEKFGKVWNSL